MELIDDYGERRRIMTAGHGVLLVDRAGAGNKPSILHAACCRWLLKVSRSTPVRFARKQDLAVDWLNRDPLRRGRWRICPECSGQERRDKTESRPPVPHAEVGEPIQEPLRANPLAELLDRRAGDARCYAARIEFIRQYERMAGAAQGLAGVMAASIELHPHQLRVVERVLDDPFQRYLLADEVGLGKTIEAGMVIRQRLLDAPRSVVVVFCPGSLAWQWTEELDERLGLRDLRPAGIEVVPYDEDLRAFHRQLTPDLIVIDEAHRIAGGWDSADAEQSRLFKKVAELTWSTPRVLLLSATPVLQHERTFLAMLHLLDPDTFELNDGAARRFEQQMRERERIGGIFARLNDALPPFHRRRALQEIAEVFSDDQELAALAETALGDLQQESASGESERDRAVQRSKTSLTAVRAHISETYRVHRRMLRTRREAASETSYRVRGREGLLLIPDADPRREAAEAWLTRWRAVLAEESEEDPERRSTAVAAVAMFVERASGDVNAMAALARAALTLRRDQMHAAGVSPDERTTLRDLWPSDESRQLLNQLVETLDVDEVDAASESWISDVARELERRGGKCVAFAPAAPSALYFAESFRGRWGPGAVAVFLSQQTMDERRHAVRRLRRDPECRLLVCDTSGEEGLNLQEAATVVHIGLPLTAVRVEQRIGRLDRRSDGEPVVSMAPAPIAGGFVEAWLCALRDGFKIFERSSAPVQYAVENVEHGFVRTLALEGPGAAKKQVAGLGESVTAEQEKIDRVEGLDSLVGEPTRESELIEAYEAAELEADSLCEAMAGVLETSGASLGLSRCHPVRRSGLGYRLDGAGGVPPGYAGIEQYGAQLVTDRSIALADPEVRLALPGSAGVDLLRRLVNDSRAPRTFTHWETVSVDDAATVVFCCDLLVRADVDEAYTAWVAHERTQSLRPRAHRSSADAPLDRAAFQRVVDAHLEPQVVRVWISTGGEVIESTAELEQAVRGTEPQAWSSAAWNRAEVIGSVVSFEEIFDLVSTSAAAAARAIAAQSADPKAAEDRFLEEIRRDLIQRELRASRDRSAVAKGELAAMVVVLPALVRAVREPSAECIGAGLVVLTSEDLPAGAPS